MLIGLLAFSAIYVLTMAVILNATGAHYVIAFKVVPVVLSFLLAVAAVGVWQHWPAFT
jgi:hypothetical protein